MYLGTTVASSSSTCFHQLGFVFLIEMNLAFYVVEKPMMQHVLLNPSRLVFLHPQAFCFDQSWELDFQLIPLQSSWIFVPIVTDDSTTCCKKSLIFLSHFGFHLVALLVENCVLLVTKNTTKNTKAPLPPRRIHEEPFTLFMVQQ